MDGIAGCQDRGVPGALPQSETDSANKLALSRIQTQHTPQLHIQVLVDGPDGQQLTLPVHSADTVRELKMVLSNKSWFTTKHCLFFGDRELLDHQQVAELICHAQGNDKHLHVFVRAKDIRFGSLTTSTTSVSFGNWEQVDNIASTPRNSLDATCTPRGDDATALEAVSNVSELGTAVLHIVIRKSTHVSWNTARSGEFELTINATDTTNHLKQQLLTGAEDGHPSILGDIGVYHRGIRLQADRPLLEYGLNSGDVLDIMPWGPIQHVNPQASDRTAMIPVLTSPDHQLNVCWQKAADGLRAGIAPELAPSGSGGSYFLFDTSRNVVAVFKPVDEEPNMRNNPRGLAPSPHAHSVSSGGSLPKDLCIRRGILPGEGAFREIAAFLLDHGHRAGVPATAPVHLTYPDGSAKYGSLQQFVQSESDCEEMGYSAFSVAEVHKIAVLDLRLANADRNGSNILASRTASGEWHLTPIDHGYCLPGHWSDMSFGWSWWRQAQVPFDDETRDYIMSIDPEKDLAMLADKGIHIRPECATIFKAANMLLKKVAQHRLSPRDAADILERKTLRKSTMEKMHRVACEKERHEEAVRSSNGTVVPAVGVHHDIVNDDVYLKHLELLIEEYLTDLHDSAVDS